MLTSVVKIIAVSYSAIHSESTRKLISWEKLKKNGRSDELIWPLHSLLQTDGSNCKKLINQPALYILLPLDALLLSSSFGIV